jgi:hypothetical protein
VAGRHYLIVLIALLAEFEQDDENTTSWYDRLAEAVPEGVTLDELAARVGG